MTHSPYLAGYYVALHRGVGGDKKFYRRVCDKTESILELGSGDARVLLSATKSTQRVVGLEMDTGMIELAKSARAAATRPEVELLEGDMSDFHLDEKFDRVIIPYTGFFCLSWQQKRACLECVAEHLNPEGKLVLDFYSAEGLRVDEFFPDAEPAIDEPEFAESVIVDGEKFRVFEQNFWCPSKQQIKITYDYRPLGAGERFQGSITHYYMFREDISRLFREAGWGFRRLRGWRNTLGKISEQVVISAAPKCRASDTAAIA